MLQIRNNVFETNSSSTHSITISSKSEYDAWVNGDMVLDYEYERFIKLDDAIEKVAEHEKDMQNDHNDYYMMFYDPLKSYFDQENIADNANNYKDVTKCPSEYLPYYLGYSGLLTHEYYVDNFMYENDVTDSFTKKYTTDNGEEFMCVGFTMYS